MTSFFSRLKGSQKAALLAGCLGIVALFAPNPYDQARTTVDAKELALIVEGKVDHVTPDELAGWIIAGRQDFRLIDLRTEQEFAQYHIPGAENITLATLPEAGLLRNEKIILYSEGGIHSAQAWFLLRARQYRGVYILFGGLEEWNDRVLFPRLTQADTTAELKLAFEKRKEVSTFFGGTPQTGIVPDEGTITLTPKGTASGTTTTVQPAITAPKMETPAASGTAAPKKKKKEGC